MNHMMKPCSRDATIRQASTNPMPWCGRIGVVWLIWVASWCLSVMSFYIKWGVLPHGVDEWLWYPLFTSVITLPGSAGRLIVDLFFWLPPGGQEAVSGLVIVAFWPCYITLLALSIRKGRLTYFAFVAAMSLAAFIYWHYLSIAATGI